MHKTHAITMSTIQLYGDPLYLQVGVIVGLCEITFDFGDRNTFQGQKHAD